MCHIFYLFFIFFRVLYAHKKSYSGCDISCLDKGMFNVESCSRRYSALSQWYDTCKRKVAKVYFMLLSLSTNYLTSYVYWMVIDKYVTTRLGLEDFLCSTLKKIRKIIIKYILLALTKSTQVICISVPLRLSLFPVFNCHERAAGITDSEVLERFSPDVPTGN